MEPLPSLIIWEAQQPKFLQWRVQQEEKLLHAAAAADE